MSVIDFDDKNNVQLKCCDTGSEHTVSHQFVAEKTRFIKVCDCQKLRVPKTLLASL